LAYWEIFCRRWWLILGVPLLTGLLTLYLQPREVLQYRSTITLAARPDFEHVASNTSPGQSAYNAYLYSEYLLDDLAEVIKGPRFMADVQAALRDHPGGPPGGAFDARKMHRVFMVSAVSARAEDARVLAEAAGRLLTAPDAPYIAALTSERTTLSIVAPPTTSPLVEPRSYVNLLLRLVLGLALALALTMVIEAVDDRLRTARAAGEALGLPVLGEVPSGRRRVLFG
jgi:capsular polysaccharide biosynthesis protein